MELLTTWCRPIYDSEEQYRQDTSPMNINETVSHIIDVTYALEQHCCCYIMDNWEKVEKWDDYHVQDGKVWYGSNIQHGKHLFSFKRIKWIDIDMDWQEGDMYLAINERENMFILTTEQVIELAMFVKRQLVEQEEENKLMEGK